MALVPPEQGEDGVAIKKGRGAANFGERDAEVSGARLEPIRFVKRELTRPDGTTLVVDVPVYPPFRLDESRASKPPARQTKGKGRAAAREPSRRRGPT